MGESEAKANKTVQSPPASALNPTAEAFSSTGQEQPDLQELKALAKSLRRDIVTMIGKAGSGHSGGSLSAVETLVCLYFRVMRHDPQNPQWVDRDRFVLSKGHGAPALYAVLAEAGYFPKDFLGTLRRLGSPLQGHPDMVKTPGVDISTGSLGMGLSVSNGMALATRLDGRGSRIYVLMGDGECEEGETWEAAMFASHHKLDNLTAIVDHNDFQLDGRVASIVDLEPFADKWRAFGWHVLSADGHDFPSLLWAFQEARSWEGQPTVIIANTVKGKGVSFMENNNEFHGKAPNEEQLQKALEELA